MNPFTPEQRSAIDDRDHNLIVVAGAGSGKTRVLVERYLALLEYYEAWPLNAIVAITFTRKAAAEMRDRVRQALDVRARQDGPRRARWTALLGQMDSARIGTIHSLCADLLRANAAEAGLDPDFAVLEEADSAILLDAVVDEVLDAAINGTPDPQVLALFTEYEPRQIREALASPALIAADLPVDGDWLAAWHALYADALRAQVTRLRADAAFVEAARWQRPAVAPADSLLPLFDAAQARARLILTADDPDALSAALLTLADGIHLGRGSKANWGGELDTAKDHLRVFKACADEVKGLTPPGDIDARAAELMPGWLTLVRQAQIAYRAAKAARAALDFDDLERLTVALLDAHPAVSARYRQAEFRHIMVDEFQDTNQRQWAIVQRLGDLDAGGSLFVVGDPKQSIYAFRGADVSVFGATRAAITGSGGRPILLVRSFRTHRPLVEHFNAVFARLLQPDPGSPVSAYQVAYDPMQAERDAPPVDAPCVEVLAVDAKAGDGRVDPIAWEAYEVAQRLRALIDSGRPVYDRALGGTRPLRAGDVALLLRRTAHVRAYEEALRSAGLPFVTAAGRGYFGRQEVQDLLNLLAAVSNPADDLALAVALRSPLFGLSDEALLKLRWPPDDSGEGLRQALETRRDALTPDDRARVDFTVQTLAALERLAGRVTIAELLREALDRTGYLAVISALPGGDQKRANVEKLIARADASGRRTVAAFTAYVRDLTARDTREGDAPGDPGDAVQIMTIHKSKGLEFPVVVLADASSQRPGGDSGLLVLDAQGGACCRVPSLEGEGRDKVYPFAYAHSRRLSAGRDEAEHLRLLYVAMTRAMDLLIVSGSFSVNKDGKRSVKGFLGLLAGDGGAIDPDDPRALIRWLDAPPPPEALLPSDARAGGEAALPVDSPQRPPLLRPVTIQRLAQARHLSASLIAELGSADDAFIDAETRRRSRLRFRRRVLQDAAESVPPAVSESPSSARRHVGDLTHRALQFWRLPTGEPWVDNPQRALLTAHAQSLGIPADRIPAALEQVYRRLREFRQGALCREIDAAPEVYRELPFVYRIQDHVIHGVIDVLYRTPEGAWVVVDYKTSDLGPAAALPDAAAHAARYHLQVGVYAEAVRAFFADSGQPDGVDVLPLAKIHYVLHGLTIDVPPETWRAALLRSTLDERIARVLMGEGDAD